MRPTFSLTYNTPYVKPLAEEKPCAHRNVVKSTLRQYPYVMLIEKERFYYIDKVFSQPDIQGRG